MDDLKKDSPRFASIHGWIVLMFADAHLIHTVTKCPAVRSCVMEFFATQWTVFFAVTAGCTLEGRSMENNDELGASRETESHGPDDSSRLAIFNQNRGLLFSIAYRMLGSVGDAEDMLQEAYIRWQQAWGGNVRTPRALLVTIITRLCINHLQSARVKREEYVGQWLPEPLVTDPGSDPSGVSRADESLSMAFLVLLERLTPVERAVFLLREIFDCEYSEIATVLDQNQVNCRQILRRARQHISRARPRFSASTEERNNLLERFLHATREGDMNGLVALLSNDVVLHSDSGGKALAVPNVIRGADKVSRGILGSLKRLVPGRGRYRIQEGHLPGFGFTISRADVAHFVIKSVENHISIGKIVGVCN